MKHPPSLFQPRGFVSKRIFEDSVSGQLLGIFASEALFKQKPLRMLRNGLLSMVRTFFQKCHKIKSSGQYDLYIP